jgi:multidrug efflux pump subunit AcrB
MESPVYAVLATGSKIGDLRMPQGYAIEQYTARLPADDARYAMKWDGEWHITYEVFRDLGLAFAVVLVLIYVLVVGWFQSFVTPLDEAVVDAGAVRFRPMLLTAAAVVVVGSAVILFDPIFQGLAIALMAGETASLLLSRMTVPVVYYIVNRNSLDLSTAS